VKLYTDKAVQKTLQRTTEIYLPDSAPYFFEHLDRILSPNFLPVEEDVVRTRIKTMGINEISFDLHGNIFRVVDVGGQRSERRKWIHCFQDVTAIIFCVALSEYNLSLEEDETVNRMHESLQLFSEICESGWFTKITLILFLNKQDLFKDKIAKISLRVCFPEFPDDKIISYDEGVKYIQDKFVGVGKSVGKLVYSHVTFAIETGSIRFVFDAVKDTIIQGAIIAV